MPFDAPPRCITCIHLAEGSCQVHRLAIDNPAFTLCRAHQPQTGQQEPNGSHWPELLELTADWIYQIAIDGEATPTLQTIRKRRNRSARPSGQLLARDTESLTVESPSRPSADRFEGALLGVAAGDAVGFPGDGLDPAQIEFVYGKPIDTLLTRLAGWQNGVLGQTTKDTAWNLAMARSLLESGTLDLDRLCAHLINVRPSALRAGSTMTAAIERLVAGQHWSTSGLESEGAGSTIRIVPLALRYCAQPIARRQAICLQSLPTHRSALAMAAGLTFAEAICALLHTELARFEPAAWLVSLHSKTSTIDARLAQRIARVQSLWQSDLPIEAGLKELRTGGHVLECLPAALLCVARSAHDARGALLAATNAGFDASTVAAMTGSMLGALGGKAHLPAPWLATIEHQQELSDIALALHQLV